MEDTQTSGAGSSQLCVTPQRKRTWTPGSITNAYSAKRRRVSAASFDWQGEAESEVSVLGACKTSTVSETLDGMHLIPKPSKGGSLHNGPARRPGTSQHHAPLKADSTELWNDG